MSDFYDILMAQPEEEAKEIALSLELFVNGSLNIFNHQTNVDVDNRFVVYGIRDLGTELSPIYNACYDGVHSAEVSERIYWRIL